MDEGLIDRFKQMKFVRQARRRENQEVADACLPELRRTAEVVGLQIVSSAPGHWLVRRGDRSVAQWWPSTCKWQLTPTQTNPVVRNWTVEKFIEWLASQRESA